MSTTYEAELASALHDEFARRRGRTPRGRTTEPRPAVALLQNERARRAASSIGRHCGFCGAPACECGLNGYVT